jgi:LysM repeat protein
VRVLANEASCFNDNPRYNRVCGDSYDWDWWYHYHYAGSEAPRQVNVAALNGTMPIFRTQALSLGEAQNEYTRLGDVFGVTNRKIQQADDPIWVSESNGKELEMDSSAGLYGYTDLNNLWTAEEIERAYMPEMVSITANDAKEIADTFLTDNNLMSSDAQFYEVVSDTVASFELVSDTVSSKLMVQQVEEEEPVVWQVIYSRILTYTPSVRDNNIQEPIEFSVIGPGAKQKVYVSANASRSTESDSVLGALGGWRQLEQARTANGVEETAAEVEMLPADQIYKLHEELEELVVLNSPPIDADQREIITHTVAYWEEGLGASQSELIPVYALQVRYTSSTTDTEVIDHAYIPVNQSYMRPFARIESAPTERVQVGQVVSLKATEAATTLADLGYDASLDFVLGSGTADDYIYTWYVNSVDEANEIGTGREIEYTVTGDTEARSGMPQQTIILMVTDITNPSQPSTTTNVSLDLYSRIFLPLTIR